VISTLVWFMFSHISRIIGVERVLYNLVHYIKMLFEEVLIESCNSNEEHFFAKIPVINYRMEIASFTPNIFITDLSLSAFIHIFSE
jgi:hypothetical protein